MHLDTILYSIQQASNPDEGNYILAHYNENSIVVYQAYNSSIGHFAAKQSYFGHDFSLSRTSWIKTNFLWMMYRSQWGTAPNQEVVLAIVLKRDAFDDFLSQAVHSSYQPAIYSTITEWKAQLERSSVIVQWDPDHNPLGQKMTRRAVQIGLRREALIHYVKDAIVRIEDISDFVAQQRSLVQANMLDQLIVPHETIYSISDSLLKKRLDLSS